MAMANEKELSPKERKFLECVEANKLFAAQVHLNVHLANREISRAPAPVFPDVREVDVKRRDEFGFSNHFDRNSVKIEFGFGSLTVARRTFNRALTRFLRIERVRTQLGLE